MTTPFVNLGGTPPTPPTPAQAAVQQAQAATLQTWSDVFNEVQAQWQNTWQNPNVTPDVIVAAMGTGAVAAFTMFAAFVACLTATAPLVGLSPDLTALLATFAVPPTWTVTFNQDGSAVATAVAQT